MTKPAERTITYTVYPPDWEPGTGGYFNLDTLKKAKRKAEALGKGAEIWRSITKRHKPPKFSFENIRAFCSSSYAFEPYAEVV